MYGGEKGKQRGAHAREYIVEREKPFSRAESRDRRNVLARRARAETETAVCMCAAVVDRECKHI